MRHRFLKSATLLLACFAFGIADATPVLLFAAGGGGGAGAGSSNGTEGQYGTAGTSGQGSFAGAGGTAGSGGSQDTIVVNGSGAGAGWLSSGASGPPPFGAQGGTSGGTWAGGAGSTGGAAGGYGGGGGALAGFGVGGGGGGYSGGGSAASLNSGGGGGGSFIDTSLVTAPNALPGINGSTARGSAGVNGYISINGVPFVYTGAAIDWFAPTDATYSFFVFGAQGGGGKNTDGNGHVVANSYGGYGALVQGQVHLTAGTELEFIIGGGGATTPDQTISGGGGGGGTFVYFVPSIAGVPEPATLALVGLGFAGLMMRRRTRRPAIFVT